MKKICKIAFCFLMVAILITSSLVVNISAASATTHFAPGKSEYDIGEQITVTIKVNVGQPTYSIDGNISYDKSVVEYVSGGGIEGNTVKVAETFSGEKEVSVSVVFKTIAEGKCNFSFSGFCTDGDLNTHDAKTGYFINVKKPATSSTPSTPTLSDNANLASLKVSGATLSPKFNSNTTSYTATVPFTTDKVTISAGAADGGATFTGAGTFSLNVGDNSKTITVTAASGAKKSYKVVIKRLPEEQQGNTDEPATPTVDPLLISAEGATRKIMQDISSMPVPESFTATTAQIGDVQVGALTEFGKKYTLYYTTLEDGSDAALYHKDDNGEYRRLRYIEVNGKFYIIADSPDGIAPNGWYRDTMNVTGGSVRAYRSEDPALSDFYILYCYADVSYGFYRFDALKTTIQRAPDFKLDIPVSNDDEVIPPQKESIFKRFGNMNPTGKAVIILIGLAIICVAALVVLLVLRLTGTEKPEEDEDTGLFLPDDEEYLTEETESEIEKVELEIDEDALDDSEEDGLEEENTSEEDA